ncbi:MAG: YIP1 family protein, partial [Planctomycetes bacterium]|nr:YIP1 family protein [Planctomycetota bacterium]
RVEDVAAWGWPLLLLVTAVALIGYATVQTGLIDRQVDRQVGKRIEQIDKVQRDVVERSALRELYDNEYKKGAFEKLLRRIQVVVAEPVKALAAALLVAAVLYGVVALTGRKPEWHTLLTICVYAGFIDALRLLTELVLLLRYATLEVYTSPVPLIRYLVDADAAEPALAATVWGLLAAADPFRIWFWVVVIVGLSVTAQLRGWRAWLVCALCWLIAAAVRTGLVVASAASVGGPHAQAG